MPASFPLRWRAVPGFTGTLGSVVPDAQTFIGTLFKGVAKVLTNNYTFNAQVVNVSADSTLLSCPGQSMNSATEDCTALRNSHSHMLLLLSMTLLKATVWCSLKHVLEPCDSTCRVHTLSSAALDAVYESLSDHSVTIWCCML